MGWYMDSIKEGWSF